MVQDIIEGQEKRVRIMWRFRDSLKEEVINIEKLNGDLEPMMEKMMLKMPHLAHDIFKDLDNKSLANCRLLGNFWKQEIDNNKKLLIIQWKQVRQTKLICKDLEESSFEAHLTIWKETFDLVEFMTVDNIKLFLKISRTFTREVLVRNEVDKTEAPFFPVAILEKVAYKFTKVLFRNIFVHCRLV